MRLSIVIPCYNVENYLQQCIESILVQGMEMDDYEIIIINDGSTDNTKKIASEFAKRYSNIVLHNQDNSGLGITRNKGIDLAHGQYIYFLDSDDYLAEGTLLPLVDLAEKHHLEILTFNSRTVKNDEYLTISENSDLTPEIKITDGITYIASNNFKNEVWWYLIRKDIINDLGIRFITGKWMEDGIFTAQLFCQTNKIAHIPIDAHRYRLRPDSAMRKKSPQHYKKIIDDLGNAAYLYNDIIKMVTKEHPLSMECCQRLKTRQQSFIFFLLVRFVRSNIPLKNLNHMLKTFKGFGAYPLKSFLGPDYNGIRYSLLVFVFNNALLIKPTTQLYRTLIIFNK